MSRDGHTRAGVHCPILQAWPAPIPVATQTGWQSGHGPGGLHASRRVRLCSVLCPNGQDSRGRVPMDGGPGALAGPSCPHSLPSGWQCRAEPLSCPCDDAAPRGSISRGLRGEGPCCGRGPSTVPLCAAAGSCPTAARLAHAGVGVLRVGDKPRQPLGALWVRRAVCPAHPQPGPPPADRPPPLSSQRDAQGAPALLPAPESVFHRHHTARGHPDVSEGEPPAPRHEPAHRARARAGPQALQEPGQSHVWNRLCELQPYAVPGECHSQGDEVGTGEEVRDRTQLNRGRAL